MTFPLIQLSEDFPRDVGELPNILRVINRKGDYTWIKKNCPHQHSLPYYLSKYDSLTKSKSLSL